MKRCLTVVAAAFAAVFAVTAPVLADDRFGARLLGREEVPSISTTGQGFFFATLNDAGTQLTYSLVYFDMESPVTQSHIHIGQTSVNGGIVLFLCTNSAPPAGVPVPPPCPNGPGFNNVIGTLTAANVVSVTGQGIGSGEFGEVIHAMRGGFAYANAHTSTFPGGEIRGQITH
jgi:CHRD domain-containing protein